MNTRSNPHFGLTPSAWVERFAHLVAPGARVLDLAAGRGRQARLFAGRGARVVAVDRDAEALAASDHVAGIETRVVDLEAGAWPFAGDTFDAIVVIHYLHRPLFAPMLDALAADGVLLYETFATGNEAYGRPTNPDHLLGESELLERVRERLVVVGFEQGRVTIGDGLAVVQRIAAVGRARRWPPPLVA